ncbi:MAG: TolC family protein [Bryobacterales bacterium]|nr:TolC family protein [Bryobacterales bacterium]
MKFLPLVLAVPLLAAPVEIPEQLSLRQALDLALKNSAALRRAAAQLQQAEAQSAQAHSQNLPQVTVAAYDILQTVNLRAMGIDVPLLPARVGPFQVVDARAFLSQNVLNLPVRDRERAAREQTRSVAALAGNARELLALQVGSTFAQALRAQSSQQTLERQLELARKLHQITQDRLDAGVASRLEATRSLQQVNNLAQAVEEARHQAAAAKLQLANLLNARITSSYTLVDEPAAALEVSSNAVAQALEARPDYRAALARIKAAEFQVSAARRQRYPVIQFRADYGQSGRKPFQNLNTFHLQGILNVPIYTGGRIEAEIAEAQARVNEARAMADEIRSQVETDVLTAVAATEAAQRELDIARSGVKLAAEELDLASARFTSGVADNTEIVNAQDRLARAEDNVVRAAYNRDLALTQLRRALGLGGQS